MKRFIPYIIFAAIIGFTACQKKEQGESAELEIPVSVQEVTVGSIKKYINTSGTAMATSDIELKTEMAGKYKLQINPRTNEPYRLGDKVKKGDVVIRLEDSEYENNIAIDAKKLDLDINEQEFGKQQSLYKKGGVTLREMKNAEKQLINARYNYANAKLSLEKMAVKAPFNGVIVELPFFTPKTKINNGTAVIKMMAYSNMYMQINLPEKNITEIKVGQLVNITNYTIPEDTLQGKVLELSPAISTETRTFQGVIKIENPKLKLRPGMFVNADIEINSKDSVIVIPKDIIISNGSKKRVFIVEKRTARERRLHTGLENDEMIQIKSGLKAGDRLVIKGFETLKNGSKVKILK